PGGVCGGEDLPRPRALTGPLDVAGFSRPVRLPDRPLSPADISMLAMSLLVSNLAATPIARPRECAHCGVYSGPNVARVVDPYLREKDVWPEFESETCRFEVARSAFVTLPRDACASEASYRAANMHPRGSG
ncbi:MAG: hypothetical protein ABI877_23300, partial [Gemmatimonadaceae bacterium]